MVRLGIVKVRLRINEVTPTGKKEITIGKKESLTNPRKDDYIKSDGWRGQLQFEKEVPPHDRRISYWCRLDKFGKWNV